MAALVAGHESSRGGDDPPPGHVVTGVGAEEPADGAGGAWSAGLGRDLAVRDDLAGTEPGDDSAHPLGERRLTIMRPVTAVALGFHHRCTSSGGRVLARA